MTEGGGKMGVKEREGGEETGKVQISSESREGIFN